VLDENEEYERLLQKYMKRATCNDAPVSLEDCVEVFRKCPTDWKEQYDVVRVKAILDFIGVKYE